MALPGRGSRGGSNPGMRWKGDFSVDFAFHGSPADLCMQAFADRLARALEQAGHAQSPPEDAKLILTFVDSERPRPFRRRAQATYVVALLRLPEPPDDILRGAYAWMIRSLGNLLIAVVGDERDPKTYFVTLERGYYETRAPYQSEQHLQELVGRLTPLAESHLIVDNVFDPDLEEDLWSGGGALDELFRAGRALDNWGVLPTPFPIEEILPADEYRHVQRLFQLGGLSYGNLSRRHDRRRFWMSASGVDKSNLREVGKDVQMVKDFDPELRAMRLSQAPWMKGHRVSVDAIEHHIIYREHPQVGAIIHVHAWMDGVRSTEINYPCGTIELAEAVAQAVREADDPSRAVVGLKNHGLTITGRTLDDIMERVDGRIISRVPMS